MTELIRNLLLLALAGGALTAIGSGVARWSDGERRLKRMLTRALGGEPQMPVLAADHGRGAALNLEQRRIAVLWDHGHHGLVYRIEQLVGAELVIDDRVAARAFRGEPRRALDEMSEQAKRVLLRLVFDTPANPDFELVLWPPGDPARAQGRTAFDAVQAARTWVSSAEALLRQPLPVPPPPPPRIGDDDPAPVPSTATAVAADRAPVAQRPPPEDPPWDEDEDEDEDDFDD